MQTNRPLLALLFLTASNAASAPVISGVVVNGTRQNQPLSQAEVVLRAGDASALFPVAQTTTDEQGRFSFAGVPADPQLLLQAGANHHGIHYPGPRFRLDGRGPRPIELVVFDAVAAPSPLRAASHDIDIVAKPQSLEVTETLVLVNPSRTTYVGEAGGGFATTLSLAIPESYERVTFQKEFFGRRFHLIGGRLLTDVPWTPGQRTLKFTYYLPMTDRRFAWARPLDLPCDIVRVGVRGTDVGAVTCNLPASPAADAGTVAFASTHPLLAGRQITVHLGDLPVPWMRYGRWVALVLLCLLILGTLVARGRGRSSAGQPQPRPRSRRRPAPPPAGARVA